MEFAQFQFHVKIMELTVAPDNRPLLESCLFSGIFLNTSVRNDSYHGDFSLLKLSVLANTAKKDEIHYFTNKSPKKILNFNQNC